MAQTEANFRHIENSKRGALLARNITGKHNNIGTARVDAFKIAVQI